MQIVGLTAEPDPRGGSIVLNWTNPSDASLAGIKILRRELTLPLIPADFGTGAEIHDDPAAIPGSTNTFFDTGAPAKSLRGEIIYYYAVVARDTSAAQFPTFISAMATSPYKSGAYLYKNLPGIYQTYDTALPAPGSVADPADESKGQLLRFTEMFGLQFDLIRSFTSGMSSFFDVRQIDGNLLQLLAQSIGWQSNFTLPFSKQRNEITYAPNFYHTIGVPANLRAMVNRVVTWDAQLKEFASNIFRSSEPERLALYSSTRTGTTWQPEALVTLDPGHEGRVVAFMTAEGPRLIYDARQDVPRSNGGARPEWQLYYKSQGQDGWLPAHTLTSGETVNRHPAAVQRGDGCTWLFWAGYELSAGRQIPNLKLQILATGREALRARIQGTLAGPFAFAGGDQLKLIVSDPSLTFPRTVTFRTEDFADISQATSLEVAAVLNREIPFVDASLTAENLLVLESQNAGSGVSIQVLPSALATSLGIAAPITASGADALAATLKASLTEPFALSAGDQLTILRNGDTSRIITFDSSQFLNIGAATAIEVASAINSFAPGAATATGGQVSLVSNGSGEAAVVSVYVTVSSAASKLGFGVPPPSLPVSNSEPFHLLPNDQLLLRDNANARKIVIFKQSDFLDMTQARAEEVAGAISAVVPGAAFAVGGQVVLSSIAKIEIPTSSAAAKLGLDVSSVVNSPLSTEPFNLSPGDALVIQGRGEFRQTVTFNPDLFADIAAATADEVAATINAALPQSATAVAGQILLTPLIGADTTVGNAVITLGIGNTDETEPSVFEDASKNLWLFWSSRRSGDWKIWFSQFDGAAWGAPKQLTTGQLPDREPAAIFDAASSRIWVFWSRKKSNGLWNVFFRDTTKLDFTTLADADWTESELIPVPADPPGSYDNKEPMPVLLAGDSLELYFTSNRSNGWNSWSKPISSAVQGVDAQVTTGQFTRRSPVPLMTAAGEVTVWYRSNKTQIYTSKLYLSAQTVDARSTGSLTADTRNPARLSLRGNIQDIQHYTYHTPSHDPTLTAAQILALEEKRLYSRDTVGVFLVPDTSDEELIVRNQALIAETLSRFLPIQVRVVFVIDQVFSEYFYSYGASGTPAPLIGEETADVVLSEVIGPLEDEFTDTADFKFMRTWATGIAAGTTPDLTVHPPDVQFRMPIAGIGEGA